MSEMCQRIGHGPVDTSSFEAVKKTECAVCQIEAKDQRIAKLLDSEEMAWAIIANAYGGDWELANKEWREAAIRWRDKYFASLPASEDTRIEEKKP